MKLFKVILLTSLLMSTTSALAGGFIKGLSDKKIAQLESNRKQALADDKLLNEQALIITDYERQTYKFENNMPIDPEKVAKALENHQDFLEDELVEAKQLLDKMVEKYQTRDAKSLEVIIRQRANPEEATGIRFETGFKSYQMMRAIQTIERRTALLKQGLAKANRITQETEKRNEKKVSIFPENKFNDVGDLANLRLQAKAALVSPKISNTDMLNVAITSNWTKGVFPVTNIPYRTIRGSVLFKDTDNDGLCRFNGYTFISVNGGELEYKAVRGGGDGYANCEEGMAVNGGLESSNGFLSHFTWLLLVFVNLITGLVILKDKFVSIVPLRNVIAQIEPYNIVLGLVAIGLGSLGFIMAFLSLNLLSNIVPQVSAVLVGTLLSGKYLMTKKEGLGEHIAKIQPFTQALGMASIGIGISHLIFSGGLYFI